MNMHTATRYSIILGMLLVAVVGVSATPGVPHQFYGNVQVNGEPAADGLFVTAEIGGETFGTGLTGDGRYGYERNTFKVEDPQGIHETATIVFYVEGERAGTHTFTNGHSTRLDLSLTLPETPTGGTTGSSRSGGGGGGVFTASRSDTDDGSGTTNTTAASATGTCTPDWDCSEWTVCSNNVRKRVCVDQNGCGTDEGKPELTESCNMTAEEIFEQSAPRPGLGTRLTGLVTGASGLGALLFFIAVGLIGGALVWRRSKN